MSGSLAFQKLEQLLTATFSITESKRKGPILRDDKTDAKKRISLRSAETSIRKLIFIYVNGTDLCL